MEGHHGKMEGEGDRVEGISIALTAARSDPSLCDCQLKTVTEIEVSAMQTNVDAVNQVGLKKVAPSVLRIWGGRDSDQRHHWAIYRDPAVVRVPVMLPPHSCLHYSNSTIIYSLQL